MNSTCTMQLQDTGNSSPNFSFLDLVNKCDNVYVNRLAPRNLKPNPFASERLVRFKLSSVTESPTIGLLRPIIVEQLRAENTRSAAAGLPETWAIPDDIYNSEDGRCSSYISFAAHLDSPTARTAAMADMCKRWRDEGLFSDVIGPRKWRDEAFAVLIDPFGPLPRDDNNRGNLAFELERTACKLFGIISHGAHMTVCEGYAGAPDVKMWVPRRAKTKQTWPGYLDNTVAGGIPSGYGPMEAIIKEAKEEASIPEDVTKAHARAAGLTSYFGRKTAGGWLEAEVIYVYDMHIPPSPDTSRRLIDPKPSDGEVESFELLPLEEVILRLHKGEFKPNTEIVIIDFLVRKGYLTHENEPDYAEIVTRLHRRFDFDNW